MYNSPIELLATDIQNQILKQQDEEIYQVVLHYVPNVDKEELLRALKYDRDQYEKGYLDGKADAMASIVRCKDCEFALSHPDNAEKLVCRKGINWRGVEPNHYCSYGERRTDNEKP